VHGTIDEPTKTIVEATYGPTVSLQTTMLFLQLDARLLGSSRSSIARISTSIFLGYATVGYNNIYGSVLLTEKDLVVQVAFDPNLFSFTDKSSDNPSYKCLHTLLGRGLGCD